MDLDGFLWRTSGIYPYTWFSPVFLCWSICNASVFAWKSTWRGHDLVPKKTLLTKLPQTAVLLRLANCRAWQTAMVSQAVFIPWTAPCQPGGNRTHMICMVNLHVPRKKELCLWGSPVVFFPIFRHHIFTHSYFVVIRILYIGIPSNFWGLPAKKSEFQGETPRAPRSSGVCCCRLGCHGVTEEV